MPRPCTRGQADQALALLRGAYAPEILEFSATQTGYDRWEIVAVRPGEAAGLVFHPLDLDNGASGIDVEVQRRLNALAEGVPYVPPHRISFGEFITGGANRYDDVMSHSSGQLHASAGTVVDGGVTEAPPASPAAVSDEALAFLQTIADSENLAQAVDILTEGLRHPDPIVAAAAASTIEVLKRQAVDLAAQSVPSESEPAPEAPSEGEPAPETPSEGAQEPGPAPESTDQPAKPASRPRRAS